MDVGGDELRHTSRFTECIEQYVLDRRGISYVTVEQKDIIRSFLWDEETKQRKKKNLVLGVQGKETQRKGKDVYFLYEGRNGAKEQYIQWKANAEHVL